MGRVQRERGHNARNDGSSGREFKAEKQNNRYGGQRRNSSQAALCAHKPDWRATQFDSVGPEVELEVEGGEVEV